MESTDQTSSPKFLRFGLFPLEVHKKVKDTLGEKISKIILPFIILSVPVFMMISLVSFIAEYLPKITNFMSAIQTTAFTMRQYKSF